MPEFNVGRSSSQLLFRKVNSVDGFLFLVEMPAGNAVERLDSTACLQFIRSQKQFKSIRTAVRELRRIRIAYFGNTGESSNCGGRKKR